MKKRLALLTIATLIATSMLAGCSNSESVMRNSESATTETTIETTETTIATESTETIAESTMHNAELETTETKASETNSESSIKNSELKEPETLETKSTETKETEATKESKVEETKTPETAENTDSNKTKETTSESTEVTPSKEVETEKEKTPTPTVEPSKEVEPAPIVEPTPEPEPVACTHSNTNKVNGTEYKDGVGSCGELITPYDIVCADCGAVVDSGETGHGWVHGSSHDLDAGKEATCTEDGYSPRYSCDCGGNTGGGVVIPATGHVTDTWYTGEVSEDGSKAHWITACVFCGEVEDEGWD